MMTTPLMTAELKVEELKNDVGLLQRTLWLCLWALEDEMYLSGKPYKDDDVVKTARNVLGTIQL